MDNNYIHTYEYKTDAIHPGKKRYTYYVYILCMLLVQAMYVFGVQIRNTVLVQVGCMLRARNM